MDEPQWDHSLQDWMLNAGAELLHKPYSLPITITKEHGPKANCYITSPKVAWFDYAAQETKGRFFIKSVLLLLSCFAHWMGLNKNIIIGNFPVSTNIWHEEQELLIVEKCKEYGQLGVQHFLFVRNLLSHHHAALMEQIKGLGFVLLPARVVYEFDLRNGLKSKPSHLMRDLSAFKKSTLKVELLQTIDQNIANRLQYLYELIYIRKHSVFNANYTPVFFSEMINSTWMQCLTLTNASQEIVAFALLYKTGETLTVPALGYLETDSAPGLYRLLFAAIFNHTLEHRLLLNYSSGAGDFKRKRGGQGRLEYTAVKAPPSFLNWKAKLLCWIGMKTHRLTKDDLIQWGA